MELKKHATPVELVPDNETLRFGPGAVKKSSRAAIFTVAMRQNLFLLRASLLNEEVTLLLSIEVVKHLGGVINVAEKTLEFRNFQNDKVLLEVVAGHLTMDLKPKHASALQKQLTPQMWEQARHGQEATTLQPFSGKSGLDSSSTTHHVVTTATLPEDSSHHQTDTGHGQTDVSSCTFQASSSRNHLVYGVCWRSRARELLPFRRRRRRPADARAYRTLYEGDVPIMVSGSPSLGKRLTPSQVRRVEASDGQQTNYFDNQEKKAPSVEAAVTKLV